jgi:TatD DNase family protein
LPKKVLQTLPFIDIHTHRFVSANDILVVENVFAADIPGMSENNDRFFSAGLHPWHINALNPEHDIRLVEEVSPNPQILAIGEAGLDRLCNVDFELQKQVFTKQLEIATNAGKPMIIHCVKAFPEIVSLYLKSKSNTKFIFHGFNNNLQTAGSLLKQGFYLSFGHALLNQKSNAFRIFRQIPDDRFFLETDDSGNSIEEIYAEAARIKGISILETKTMVFKNLENCFKINL